MNLPCAKACAEMRVKMIKKIILAGLTVIWIAGFILSWNFFLAGPNYWLGFLFGLMGLAVAAINIFLPPKGSQSTTETRFVPIYYTIVYVILVMLLNLCFSCVPFFWLRAVFIVANLLLLLIYGVLFYGAVRHLTRAANLTEYAAQKQKNAADISCQISVLLSSAKDKSVKTALLKLKETVAYSNNMSQQYSVNDEAVFLQKLYKIQEDLSGGTDTETVLNEIKEAADMWNIRNSRIGSIR